MSVLLTTALPVILTKAAHLLVYNPVSDYMLSQMLKVPAVLFPVVKISSFTMTGFLITPVQKIFGTLMTEL